MAVLKTASSAKKQDYIDKYKTPIFGRQIIESKKVTPQWKKHSCWKLELLPPLLEKNIFSSNA